MISHQNTKPWKTNLRQEGIRGWILEVELPETSQDLWEQIIRAVDLYNTAASPLRPSCTASAEQQNRLFFTLTENSTATPVPAFGSNVPIDVSQQQIQELANSLIKIAESLHQVQLGLWLVDENLCWRVGNHFVIIPAFWLPWLDVLIRSRLTTTAPEAAILVSLPAFSEAADIFAISFACYEILADGPPKLPHPKLPGEWDSNLKQWDAALDSGLRSKAERRPQTIREWAGMISTPQAVSPPTPRSSPGSNSHQPRATPETARLPTKTKKLFRRIVLSVVMLLLIACIPVILKIAPIFGFAPLTSSSYKRGFANSVLQYADKKYDGAKWKIIYNGDRLRPGDVDFQKVTGWDKNYFSILGEFQGDTVVLHFRNGEWLNEKHAHFTSYQPIAKYLSDSKIVIVLPSPNDQNDLVLWEPSGITRLAKKVKDCKNIFLVDGDSYCGNNDYPKFYWKFSGGKYTNVEDRARGSHILTEDNSIATASLSNGGKYDLETANINSVTAIAPGNSLGIHKDTVTQTLSLVRYQQENWYLIKELEEPTTTENQLSSWILDKNNFVVVGDQKIVRVIENSESGQSLTVAGQEYPAQALTAVWGRNMKKYWVADNKGNVFEFNGERWNLLVRGPEFDADIEFKDIWVSPEGSIIAITEDNVYGLE